ncbi:MAG TPA: methyltransferase domain-containing protein [Humisphaera sp.]|nr:methyltransferase domain-containing protein [Humisphaera sp.]
MAHQITFKPLRNASQMAALISEVTGEPVHRVLERLEIEHRHPGQTVAQDFARHGARLYTDGPEMAAFYESTDAFLYELAVWNRNLLKQSMRHFVCRHLERRKRPLDVLCLGDGLGFDSLYFASRGHRVTYFELPGLGERFARRLFEKSGADITILTDPAQIAPDAFDAVTCFDVLEHVPDPRGMVRQCVSYLREGGHFYVSAPFYMIHPLYPTHLRSNRRFSGSLRLFERAGLDLVDGRMTWYPLVFRKGTADEAGTERLAVLLTRLSAGPQKLGRWATWPFLPVHWLRRLCNRRFK